MGNRLTEDDKPPQVSATPYGDIFDELLPQYMAIGMTYDQYWDGEVGMKKAFREAYKIRIETEQRLADQNNWYMGQYVAQAIQAVQIVALVPGINAKKNIDLPKYPDKPYLEKAEEMKKEEVRRKKEEDQSKMAMAMMHAMFTQFNKNFEKRKAEEEKQKAIGTGQ